MPDGGNRPGKRAGVILGYEHVKKPEKIN